MSDTVRWWEDPEAVCSHRLPMRTSHGVFPDADTARAGVAGSGPWSVSLDGMWSVKRLRHPSAVTQSALDGPVGSWGKVAVPGNWTLQGLGDLPHYTNITMPWPGRPPVLPAEIATVVFRRTFRVPRGWRSRRTVLHVGGAESTHAVWLNGRHVGFGTDSRLPSEYDVTAHLGEGENDIAVVVTRYSAQSYVEDQDQWWMAGLHRSIRLESRAVTGIGDVKVDAGVDPETLGGRPVGTVRVRVSVDSPAGTPLARGWRVRTWLENMAGRRIGTVHTAPVPTTESPYVYAGNVGDTQWRVPNAVLWSAESPVRHRVMVELVSPGGETVECTSVVTGFRRVEIRGRDLLVNGRRVMVQGVNRHDHHPERGKAVTADDMRADIVAMKLHNVNAVRCSHYPNDPVFYDLCDELGLYVVDEANVESHAFNTSLCHDPRWRQTITARITRMVERDRNHPSIIMWSLGNESGYGAVHDAAAAWIRSVDPSRPVHYEPAVFHTDWFGGGAAATDVVAPMYAPIAAVRAYGESGRGTRPLVMCEYSHAMGNSNGSLADYWDAFDNTPGLQGGFVWEWKDHGIRQELGGGKWRFAYGGQFGDTPTDGNFVADGLNHSDLTPHPAMRELAWVHRPVAVSLAGRGAGAVLRLRNRQSFLGLSHLRADWELLVDGESVGSGRLAVPSTPPGTVSSVPVPCAVPAGRGEVHLSVRFRLARATAWAPAGHLVAWDQVCLRARRVNGAATLRDLPAPSAPVDPAVTLWRAATDNDGFKLMPHLWAGFGRSLERWTHMGLPVGDASLVRHSTRRTVLAGGAEHVEHTVHLPRDMEDVPRIGAAFTLPPRFSRLRWFGRGPHECYADRQSSAVLGTWEADPDELPYLVPQEYGARTDCRWFEVFDPATGDAVRVTSTGAPLTCSALWHTDGDLFAAADRTELTRRRFLTVHVDLVQRGLGTASCGPDTLPQYRIPAGTHRWSYVVSGRPAR